MFNQCEPDRDQAPVTRRPFRSVLLVEDDGLLSLMLQNLAEDAGATQLFPCRDAASAMQIVEANDLDCAVLDVSMSGGTTYQLADELVARGIPFLFCTGLNPDDLVERHRHRPMLCKPYSDADFHALLARTLAD